MPLLDVVNELWPLSHLNDEALTTPAADLGLPLHIMPMVA